MNLLHFNQTLMVKFSSSTVGALFNRGGPGFDRICANVGQEFRNSYRNENYYDFNSYYNYSIISYCIYKKFFKTDGGIL